jgi:hypothetical protein
LALLCEVQGELIVGVNAFYLSVEHHGDHSRHWELALLLIALLFLAFCLDRVHG